MGVPEKVLRGLVASIYLKKLLQRVKKRSGDFSGDF